MSMTRIDYEPDDRRAALAIDGALLDAMPEGSLYAVGGRVRDGIRSACDGVDRPPKDLDYVVTGVAFDDLLERLRSVGRADAVGASFAVVKCTLLGRTVDVALPRVEKSTGAHHRDFSVDFGPGIPLADDLARRDFRMNMIARRIADGAIVDPFEGEADIVARRVDVLRTEAFEEDPLRMLRAAQFAGRFAFEVTSRTMTAMSAAAPLVATVAAERTRDELIKLLEYAVTPSIGIEVLRRGGVLDFVLPEILEGFGVEQNAYHAFDVYHHNLAVLDAVPPGDLIDRLAALLHDVGKPRVKDGPHFYRHEDVGAAMAREILGRLRFPNDVLAVVSKLVAQHMYVTDARQTDASIRRFIARVGADRLARQFSLRAADIVGSGLPKRDDANERFEARVWSEVAKVPALSVADLAVDGRDVMAALARARGADGERATPGRRGSPLIGRLLVELLELVTEDPAMNEREVLLTELDSRAARAVGGDRFS